MKFRGYSLVFGLFLFAIACNDNLYNQTEQNVSAQNTQNNQKIIKVSPTPIPSVKPTNIIQTPSVKPSPSSSIKSTPIPTVTPTAISSIDDNEIVGTNTEVLKTNVNWKEFNPIVEGKTYTYVYTMSNIKAEITREITELTDETYTIEQKFVSPDGKESSLASVKLSVTINSDNSPSIIPIVSVGGEKVDTNIKLDIAEQTEKINVPFGEFDAIKLTTTNNNISTINWYAKNIGLIKAVQTSTDGTTFTLELKKYN